MGVIVVRDIIRSFQDEEERRHNFLLKWREEKGSSATYKALIDALLAIGCRDDAEEVLRLLASRVHDQSLGAPSPNERYTGISMCEQPIPHT